MISIMMVQMIAIAQAAQIASKNPRAFKNPPQLNQEIKPEEPNKEELLSFETVFFLIVMIEALFFALPFVALIFLFFKIQFAKEGIPFP